MTEKHRFSLLLPAAIAVSLLFGAGILQFFRLRFETGDIYPAYSSLRSDPLGTRALFESLAACPGITVSRNYKAIDELEIEEDTALLFLGDSADLEIPVPRHVIAAVNRDIRRGMRLVVTLRPRNWMNAEDEEREDATGERNENEADREEKEIADSEPPGDETSPIGNENGEYSGIDLSGWLGLAIEDVALEGKTEATLNPDYAMANLPARISCHSSICFRDLTNDWRVVYFRAGKPVVVERPMRSGSIVISALSFFVSNEALRFERHPALLAWLFGDARRVVFDEYHHGLTRPTGLASLLRRHRLHGLAAALVLLAGLFAWKNVVGLVPPDTGPEKSGQAVETGKGSRSALVNILRRNIPAGSILPTAFQAWLRGADLRAPGAKERIAAAERLLRDESPRPRSKRSPVETYVRLCGILNPGSGERKSAGSKENKE